MNKLISNADITGASWWWYYKMSSNPCSYFPVMCEKFDNNSSILRRTETDSENSIQIEVDINSQYIVTFIVSVI